MSDSVTSPAETPIVKFLTATLTLASFFPSSAACAPSAVTSAFLLFLSFLAVSSVFWYSFLSPLTATTLLLAPDSVPSLAM